MSNQVYCQLSSSTRLLIALFIKQTPLIDFFHIICFREKGFALYSLMVFCFILNKRNFFHLTSFCIFFGKENLIVLCELYDVSGIRAIKNLLKMFYKLPQIIPIIRMSILYNMLTINLINSILHTPNFQ